MNPELILSFFVMQGLAPAGTSVPVEAILTSADALPAWARFTFQVYVIQKLQEEVNNCKTELDELEKHHDEADQESETLKKEIRILFQTLRTRFEDSPQYSRVVKELQKRTDIPNLITLYAGATD